MRSPNKNINPINGKINHQYNKGFRKNVSIAALTPDDKNGGKNICNITK
jgi:hypothetical protein